MFVFARVHNGVRVSNQRRESALFRWLSSPATVDKEKKGGGGGEEEERRGEEEEDCRDNV